MDNTKFTKGNWAEIHVSNDRGDYYKVMAENVSICNVTTRNSEQAKANAKLIASAPEMFEMLQRIVLMTETCEGNFSDFRDRYNFSIKELLTKITE